MNSRRFIISLGIISLLLYGAVSWISLQFNWGEGYADRPIAVYVAIYLGLFAVYAVTCGVVLGWVNAPSIFPAIVVFGFLFRAILIPSQQIQEDDVYRYLWDGKVFAQGINPYKYSPSEVHDFPTLKVKNPEALKKKYSLQDQEELRLLNKLKWENDTALIYLERVNHPDIPTIYPPLAQYVFRIVHFIRADNIYAMRLAFLVFDLAAFWFIVRTLSVFGISRNYSVIYFWSPLIIKETFNSTHLDLIGISMLCASIYFLVRARDRWATVFLSLSFLGKLYPIILLPLYLKRIAARNREAGKPPWREPVLNGVLFSALACAGYIPFLNIGRETLEGLKTFTTYFQSNDSIFALLVYAFGKISGMDTQAEFFLAHNLPTLLSKITVALVLAGTLGFLLFKPGRNFPDSSDCVRNLFVIMALVFLLSPVQNPWYLCWIVPFLCFFPKQSFILLTGLVGLYYLDFYFDYQDIAPYSAWLPWLEYTPFYVLLGIEWQTGRRIKLIDK